ncbi:hypothetical protein Ssi03_57220 [Sphaerisporangium siamense]|nr:hypothetical protein Ssi03_57220 [Sphaerisporangium siamense]
MSKTFAMWMACSEPPRARPARDGMAGSIIALTARERPPQTEQGRSFWTSPAPWNLSSVRLCHLNGRDRA